MELRPEDELCKVFVEALPLAKGYGNFLTHSSVNFNGGKPFSRKMVIMRTEAHIRKFGCLKCLQAYHLPLQCLMAILEFLLDSRYVPLLFKDSQWFSIAQAIHQHNLKHRSPPLMCRNGRRQFFRFLLVNRYPHTGVCFNVIVLQREFQAFAFIAIPMK